MTVPASYAKSLGERLPSQDDQAIANQLRKIIASQIGEDEKTRLKVIDDGQTSEVVLTPAISKLLMELLRHVGRGDAVTLVPVCQQLTTQQAADLLNISRPYLVKLLDSGIIEHTKVGRHRRILAEHVFEYKERRDAEREKALQDLADIDSDLI